jgi:hypothetical protein
MKNLILIIGMFVATSAMAQMEVNQVKDSTVYERTGIAQPHFSIMMLDEANYTIYFRNAKYTHIVDIQYLNIGTKGNLKQLLELCIKACVENADFQTEKYMVDRYTKKIARVWTEIGYFYIQTKECQAILDAINK